MANHDDYVALEQQISAVTAETVNAPDRPVEVLAKEGEKLLNWVKYDKAGFDSVNFDWTIVDSLGQRIGAALHADAIWSNKRFQQQDSLKKFKALRLKAEKLRMDVLAALAYACFGMEDVERTIADIRQGDSNADLIMDLTRCYALLNQNIEHLKAIKFDLSVIEEVAKTAGELGELLGQSDSDKLLNSKEIVMRDKSFTYLKTAIDKIRVCGKFVCSGNDDRLYGYFSEYTQSKNRRARKGKDPTSPSDPTETK
jgi:hypothetical protein